MVSCWQLRGRQLQDVKKPDVAMWLGIFNHPHEMDDANAKCDHYNLWHAFLFWKTWGAYRFFATYSYSNVFIKPALVGRKGVVENLFTKFGTKIALEITGILMNVSCCILLTPWPQHTLAASFLEETWVWCPSLPPWGQVRSLIIRSAADPNLFWKMAALSWIYQNLPSCRYF